MTTSFASVASLRGRTRLLIGASLAPAANAQYDADFYDWCMNNLDEGSDYCCEHSGGVVRSGACIDPDDLLATVDVGPSRPVHPIRPGVVAPATRQHLERRRLAPRRRAGTPQMTDSMHRVRADHPRKLARTLRALVEWHHHRHGANA